ncbi:MAG TPA: alginate lyase family protein [Solirubrobacterales bacterium]|nr:alginate lyase family protein [Solirubrobacterales bacterium]
MRKLRRLREVGVAGAVRAALRRLTAGGRGLWLNWWRRKRPLRVGGAEVAAALGGPTLAEALRGPALSALPTVADFERSLTALSEPERRSILDRADAAAAHRFDLLGSGPTDLGPRIDWSLDFKSGRRWPARHRLLLESRYLDDSDVKVPWELSRFQHLPLLAAAFRLSGETRYLDEIGAQLDGWIEANPVEIGINWFCTMDVAIRAANWVAALAICAPEAASQPWAERAAGSLLLHGRFIRDNLETAEARTNHYLSDVVGLLPVAALFSEGPEGRRWGAWAVDELIAEMEHQVREDGCDHEASIPYHRLVTELFVCGTQAGEALRPGAFPDSYRQRLDRMLDFVAAYTRPDGLAPQVGDNDDGRFLPLADYGRDFRSHLHLFRQARRPYRPATRSAAFRAGGYFTMRHGDLYALVRCGDTGVYGVGSHAHNDQLSFELCHGATPLVEDPGVGTYYEDEETRLRFRSTAFHATLRVDGAEQNEMPPWPRFPIGDRSRAEATAWEAGPDRTRFAGRHHGFEALPDPALHERSLELDGPARALTVVDTVTAAAEHRLDWTFPLGCCDEVSAGGATAIARFGPLRLRVEAEGAELRVEEGAYSPAYGVVEPRPFLAARADGRPGRQVTTFRLSVE